VPPLHRRHHGRVAAEHAAREQVDLDLAAGLGLNDLGELLHPHHQRMALGVLRGEFDGFFLRKGHAEGGNRHGGGEGLEHQSFHGLSPEGKREGRMHAVARWLPGAAYPNTPGDLFSGRQ